MSSYKPLVTVWTKELSQENSQLIKQLIGEDHLTQTDINAFKTQTEINALIDAKIDDTAYNQTSWNASTDAATKNVIRDKIVAMDALIAANLTQTEANALGHLTQTDINSFLNQTEINALGYITQTEANALGHLTQTDINSFLTQTEINALGHLTQTDINIFKNQTEINTLIDAKIDDTAYNQTSWNTNTEAATKNAIRDKIVAMDALTEANLTQTEANALGHLTQTDINSFLTQTEINALGYITQTEANALGHLTQTDINSFLTQTEINALGHLTQTDINSFLTQTEINALGHQNQTEVNALIDAKIDDTAYNQTSWNTNIEAATKNAIRDKILTIDGLINANQTQTEVNALITTHKDISTAHHTPPTISDTAYNQSTWNANIDGASKNAIRDKIESLGVGPIKGYCKADISFSTGATEESGYIKLDNVNEDCVATFWVDPIVNASEDIVFTFIFRSAIADATISFKRFVAANKTDDTEDFAFNVDGGTAFNVTSITINNWNKIVYTLSAANFDSEDQIIIFMRLNESGRQIRFHSCGVTWTWA